MGDFYWLQRDSQVGYTGYYSAKHPWALPGVYCAQCGATWAAGSAAYPSVDLSSLPQRAKFEWARPEPYDEFARLRELVQPLVSPGVQLHPGDEFGPMQGTAAGSFGQLFIQNPWTLLMRRGALERLQEEGVRGLRGCRTELRFRQRKPPELLEMEILPGGRLHPACLPPDRKPPCTRCGRLGLSRPEAPVLDADSLPTDTDLFRLADFDTTILCTERFREATLRLELDGVLFREVPAH